MDSAYKCYIKMFFVFIEKNDPDMEESPKVKTSGSHALDNKKFVFKIIQFIWVSFKDFYFKEKHFPWKNKKCEIRMEMSITRAVL